MTGEAPDRQRRRQRRLLEPDVGVPRAPAALARREQPRQPGPRRELRPRLRQHRGADARLQPRRRERLEPGLGGALGPHESRLDQGDPGRRTRRARRVRRIHRSRVQPRHEVGRQQRPGRLRRLLHGRRPRSRRTPRRARQGTALLPSTTDSDFDFSANLGGPAIKDRLWYFASAQYANAVSTPYYRGSSPESQRRGRRRHEAPLHGEAHVPGDRKGPSSSGWRSSTTASSTTAAREALLLSTAARTQESPNWEYNATAESLLARRTSSASSSPASPAATTASRTTERTSPGATTTPPASGGTTRPSP